MNEMPLLPVVVKRNFWNALATFACVIGAVCVYLKVTPKIYEASARLILDDRRTSVSELGKNLAQEAAPGNANPIATQAELLTSKQILSSALTLMPGTVSTQRPPLTPDELRGNLQVKIVPATNILELGYKDADPKVAADVVNAISSAMVQQSGQSIRQEASSVRKFIESRLPQQEASLERAEAQESQFKADHKIVAINEQSNSLVVSIATLEDQERTLLAQLRESQTKQNRLKSVAGVSSAQGAYISSRVGQDDGLKDLRTRMLELDAQVIDKRSVLADENPAMQALIQKRDETRALYNQRLAQVTQGRSTGSGPVASDDLSRQLLASYVTNTVDTSAMQDKLKAVQGERLSLQNRISTLPAVQRTLATLVRRKETEAATLQQLQRSLEEARLAEAQLVSNIRIIGRAVPPALPSSPKLLSTLLLGSALGLILSIGVILLSEMLRNTVGSSAEAELELKLPILGTLPKLFSEIDPELLESFLNTPASVEPYRKLLKTLESGSNREFHSILISSVTDAEGKSNVAARLACVSAMMSRRTLLIDADLSNPLQHEFFNLSAMPGLTEVVCKDTALLSTIQSTPIANLDVLTHGQWLSRPAQVLEASAMQTLLTNAMAEYDMVIVEASAAGLYSDVMTLSQQTNGVVLVVKPEVTPKAVAQQTINELKGSGTPILGMVINETPDPVKTEPSNLLGRFSPPADVYPDFPLERT